MRQRSKDYAQVGRGLLELLLSHSIERFDSQFDNGNLGLHGRLATTAGRTNRWSDRLLRDVNMYGL